MCDEGATTASDVFSLGLVFCFVLTRGGHLFGEDPRKRGKAMLRFAVTDADDADDVEAADAAVRKRVTAALRGGSVVPPAAVETICSMLRFSPGSRPSAEDVLKSPLLGGGADATTGAASVSEATPPSECAICWDAPAVFAVVPCGHMCLCAGCLDVAAAHCPICRTPSTGTCQIYVT